MWKSSLLCIYYLCLLSVQFTSHFKCTFAQHDDSSPPVSSSSPTPLTITMILRDFKAYTDYMGHPDFNNEEGDERGITQQYLTFDKKPAYNVSIKNSITTHGQTWYNMWYRDTDYCIELRDTLTLTWDSKKQKYTYCNNSFFPLDGRGWGNEGEDAYGKIHNFGFTAEFSTFFTYQGNETFNFTGDDDVWVYINDYRIIDLGGVHNAESAYVHLSQFETPASLQKGAQYTFNFFFAERHTVSSVFCIETSVGLQDCPTADACGVCNGNATENKCIGVSCGNGTCDCNTGCCKCANGWSQPTQCGPCTSYCGNGHLESGEQCDVGTSNTINNPNAVCCDKFCHFVDAGVMCQQTTDVCKSQTCDGAGHCSSAINYNSTCVPSNPSKCLLGMCAANGTCGVQLATGTVCDTDPNPCKKMACSASGACVEIQLANGISCTASDAGSSEGEEGGACVQWTCQAGECVAGPKPSGTACPSPDLCTTGTCDTSGNCILYQNLTQCETSNSCLEPIGSCDPLTGRCTFQERTNGSLCSIPNRQDCATYSCAGGECVAQSICLSTNCDNQPKCNATTGTCQYSTSFGSPCCGNGVKESGEFCDDGAVGCCIDCDILTRQGTPCTDNNPCSNSTCDGSGNCVIHPLPSGTPCGNSGNPCTRLVCQGQAVCTEVAQTGIPCTSEGEEENDCVLTTCSSSGLCTPVAKPDNTSCTINNTGPCVTNICKKGMCNSVHVTDGTNCGKNLCGNLTCSFGSCEPASNYKICNPKDDCHSEGVCDTSTGNCSNPAQPDGHSCSTPPDASCQIWTCTSGMCNASCVVTLPFCGNGVVELGEDCDTTTTTTNNTCCVDCLFLPKGSACASDNRKCTDDVCDANGVCTHTAIHGCSRASKGTPLGIFHLLFIIVALLFSFSF